MKTTLIISILLLGIVDIICGQPKKPLTINLAELDPGAIYSFDEKKPINYDCVVLKNAVVNYVYSIEIDDELELLPPLPSLSLNGVQASKETNECPNLIIVMRELMDAYDKDYQNHHNIDEKELAKRITNLKTELKKNDCKNDSLIKEANNLINLSNKYIHQEVIVGVGEKVTIKIKRDSLEWTYIIKGRQPGQWITSYGFGFTSAAIEGNVYHTKQVSDTSHYQILKSKNTKGFDLNYVPAVFFTFLSNQNYNKKCNFSFVGGVGFDLTAPVLFVGYNGMFWQNLGLSLGFALQQQYRLKDQYSGNEIISLPLDKDQLHDKVYRPNIFIAINFRFAENPFKEKQSSTDKSKK